MENPLRPSEVELGSPSEGQVGLIPISCGMVEHPWVGEPSPGSKGLYYAVICDDAKVQRGEKYWGNEDYEEQYVEKTQRDY